MDPMYLAENSADAKAQINVLIVKGDLNLTVKIDSLTINKGIIQKGMFCIGKNTNDKMTTVIVGANEYPISFGHPSSPSTNEFKKRKGGTNVISKVGSWFIRMILSIPFMKLLFQWLGLSI